MKAAELMEKAGRLSASAQLLLDAGDRDSACNRAYYAMFNAARAALLTAKAPVEPETIKTHSGLISAFSQYLIKSALLPVELGKSLSKVSEIRLVADYSDEEITAEDAAWTQKQSVIFVAAIDRFIKDNSVA